MGRTHQIRRLPSGSASPCAYANAPVLTAGRVSASYRCEILREARLTDTELDNMMHKKGIPRAHLKGIHDHEGIELQQHRDRDQREYLSCSLEAAESLPPPLAPAERRELRKEALRV